MARRQHRSNPLISDHLRNFDRTHPARRFLGQYIGFLNNVAHEPRLVFIDETMHDPQHVPSTDRRFYAISAVVVENPDVSTLREDFKGVIGGESFWHATDAASEKKIQQMPWLNKENLQRMMDTVGDYSRDTHNILTFHSHVRYSPNPATQLDMMEQARAESITALMKVLTSDKYSANAFIFERRHNEYENDLDRNTIQRLVAHKVIPPTIKYTHTTSSIEPNLWAPDLQAWGVGQEIRRENSAWLNQAQLRPLIIDAQTLQPLHSNGPYTAPAPAGIPTPHTEQQLQQVINDLNTGVYNREIRDFEAQHSLHRGQRENFLTATHESIANQSRHHRVPPQHAKDLSHGSTPVPTRTSAEVLKNLKAQAQKTHEAAKQKPAPQPQPNHQNMTPPDTPTHQPGRGPRLT